LLELSKFGVSKGLLSEEKVKLIFLLAALSIFNCHITLKFTWHGANKFCNSRGLSLVRLDAQEKTKNLAYFLKRAGKKKLPCE